MGGSSAAAGCRCRLPLRIAAPNPLQVSAAGVRCWCPPFGGRCRGGWPLATAASVAGHGRLAPVLMLARSSVSVLPFFGIYMAYRVDFLTSADIFRESREISPWNDQLLSMVKKLAFWVLFLGPFFWVLFLGRLISRCRAAKIAAAALFFGGRGFSFNF